MSFDSPLPPYGASDPSASFLSSSCFEFLMIEVVPMAYRVVSELDERQKDGLAGYAPEDVKKDGSVKESSTKGSSVGGASRIGGSTAAGPKGSTMDEYEERDAVFYKLETLGYRVGQGMVERFSANRPHFTDPLDAIKFLCKDLWTLLFRKQIDNLKTNHRGVFVLTDNNFRPFARMSVVPGEVIVANGGVAGAPGVRETAIIRAQPYLWFPCGVIRGALASMGVNASVQAETNGLPGATFQIRSLNAKS